MTAQDKNIESIYPLMPSQQGMLFESLLAPEGGIYLGQFLYTLTGELQPLALQQAWERVTERHSALRTLFVWKNKEKPLQVVRRRVDVPWGYEDWRSWPELEQKAKLEEFLQTDRKKGFDLSRAPLMRLKLVRLADDRHELIWSNHHLLLDGWSSSLVLNEVMETYQGLCERREVALQSRRPYRDYIRWLQQQDLDRAETFWRAALAGFRAPTPLGVDRAGREQSGQIGEIREQKLEFSTETTEQLKAFCRRQNLTLNTFLQAAWALLLSRYSGEDDVVFGSVVSGRPTELTGVESMVGMFINTLPVRARFRAGDVASSWLKSFQDQLAELREHEHSPLVEVQGWSEVPRGQPLFESLFDFVNYPVDPSLQRQQNELQLTFLRGIEKTNYPLTVHVAPRDKLTVKVSYDILRFEDETVGQMLGHYLRLLEGIVADPEQRLGELPLLTEAERQQILVDWNDTARDYPRDKCIHELFEEQVERTPDAVAVIFEEQQLTYRQLNERANQLAHHLRKLGLGKGTLAGVFLGRSVNYVVGALAILKAGGAYLPVGTDYPLERLRFMLEDCDVPVVLTSQSLPGDLRLEGMAIVDLAADARAIQSYSRDNPAHGNTADDLAYVIYTSGSTGKPKGTTIPHRGVVRLVRGQHYAEFDEHQRFLLLASTSFDASTFELWGALLSGATCVVFPEGPLDLGRLESVVRRQGVTCLWLTAALFNQIIDVRPSVLETVRHVLTGGEALSVAHVKKALGRLPGLRLTNGYGPTEGTTFTTTYAIKRGETFPTGSVPIGRPLANTRCYLLDAQRQPAPVGVPAELYIGGDGLARDYLNRPELTGEKFVADPFSREATARLYRTGDRCRWLPDGNLEFLGRLDHQVKIRGFRIELGEIETVLNQHPGIREAMVVAREDTPGDKRLVAYLTAKNGEAPQVSELREFLKAKLPDYMVPAAFVTLERLPLTPNGKVDRRALPRPEYKSEAAGFIAASTPTENTLARIWCEVLGLKQVGLNDNFFELGGHSLLAMRLTSRINRELKAELPVRALFLHPTIELLARDLSPQGNGVREAQLIQLQKGNQGPELFFLIDEGSLGLLKLGPLLGDEVPVYASVVPLPEAALRASAKKRFSDLPRMEDLAAEHVARIMSHRASGALLLGGHCFGGLLAFEVAHQLQHAGQQVAVVLMLDTWMSWPGWWWRQKTWWRAHLRRLWKQGPLYLWRKSGRRIRLEKDRLAEALQLAIRDDFSIHVPWSIIERIYRHAAAGYHPEVLASRGILFVSREDWESDAYRRLDNSLGTGRWFGNGVEVMDVPGDHVSILDERHLPELAACCTKALEKFRSSQR